MQRVFSSLLFLCDSGALWFEAGAGVLAICVFVWCSNCCPEEAGSGDDVGNALLRKHLWEEEYDCACNLGAPECEIPPHYCKTANMGCVGSKAVKGVDRHQKKIKRPKPWKHTEDITRAQLKQMRDEFWDTAPHYGGKKEIWDALRAAAEAEINLAQLIVDSAGIIVQSEDLSTCYDERGAKYDLPKYVLSEPTNIKED